MQPLYDGLRDMIWLKTRTAYWEWDDPDLLHWHGVRGRTLDNAFVALDEAQNTTHAHEDVFNPDG
jgi:phosphate starvation-inducible PhoH-like protein